MLDKTLTPGSFETRLYEGWERSGAFAADPGSAAQPFTIMIPPPNVTGSLHIGHALTMTIQDTLIRWRRMQGRDALWMPGTDHAGIATQMVVERLLAAEGNQDRRGMGREAFVERVWQWKAESGGTITKQLRRLGASLDWPRERFTMDAGLSQAVLEVFVTLHKQGLIYRDRRLVNWDPKLLTAISDLEVENREVKGNLWYLRYPVEGAPGEFITVATTRPETMLGDTAVAVHPEDPRFAALVGKRVILPLVGRAIPVVADEYSDPGKGTGAVKITPAHDFNDFEVGRRHGLPMPTVLNAEAQIELNETWSDHRIWPDAALSDRQFLSSLNGQDRFVARKMIVARLEELGLLEKIEPHTHQVPHGDRGGVPIEPRLTWQWYCDAATLAKPCIAAVEDGRMHFVPKQWENTFFAWMRDIQPWCVSRQLWWGHQIPAWYAPDGTIFVEKTKEEAKTAARAKFGAEVALERDPDVLDTWFSSALWPFSTLGWPEKTAEVARYYPGDVLVTGFDIIFFWVARMMMMGMHFQDGEVPFRDIYIHGLVRDEKGQKMSKSKGNVMDPLELIDAYGADALRFTICALTGPGRDVKLGRKRVEDHRGFVTKIWNAARFLEMNGVAPDAAFDPAAAATPLARWILDAANRAVAEATAALEAYRFDEYAAACYRFTWNTFCDWFIEFAKPVLNGPDGPEKAEVKGAAQHVLGTLLRLLHPAIPFVTEELWDRFGYGPECSLIREAWPTAVPVSDAEAARIELDWVVRLVTGIGSIRSELNMPVKAKPNIRTAVLPDDADAAIVKQRLQAHGDAIIRLGNLGDIEVRHGDGTSKPVFGGTDIGVDGREFFLDIHGHIDFDAERERRQKERKKALNEIERRKGKLENPMFKERADPDIVAELEDELRWWFSELARIDRALDRLT